MHVNVIFSKAIAVILFLLPALLSILLAKCFESSLCPLGFVFSAYRSLFRFPNKRIFPIAPHSRRARKEKKILNSTKKTWTHFGGLKSRLLFFGFSVETFASAYSYGI